MSSDKKKWHPCFKIRLEFVIWNTIILFILNLEFNNNLQNIWGRVVGNNMNNIFPSNTFQTELLSARFPQNIRLCLAKVSTE